MKTGLPVEIEAGTEVEPAPIERMADGVYEGQSMADYLSEPGRMSSSLLKESRKRSDLWLYQQLHDKAGVDDDTAAKRLGSVVHTAIFEPDLLEEEYFILPQPDATIHTKADGSASSKPAGTAKYKEACEAVRAENVGKKETGYDLMAKAMTMRDQVNSNDTASLLVQSEGMVEATILHTDSEFGIPWKIRPDKISDVASANVNAKTTENAKHDVFSHQAFRFGYHISESLYHWILNDAGIEVRNSLLLVVESTGAHEVVVYQQDEALMDMGLQLVMKYARHIADAIERDEWKGLAVDIELLHPPMYAFNKVDEELALP